MNLYNVLCIEEKYSEVPKKLAVLDQTHQFLGIP
jgi:hypothetical protein